MLTLQPTHTLGNLLGFILLLQSGLILCVNVHVGVSACMSIFRFFPSVCLFDWLFCSLMVYVHVCIKCVCVLCVWCFHVCMSLSAPVCMWSLNCAEGVVCLYASVSLSVLTGSQQSQGGKSWRGDGEKDG